VPKHDKENIELPIVGIIIPCHNHAHYVLRAIKSVVQQDYPHKAICIIDDGSIDETSKFIKEYIEENGSVLEDTPKTVFGGVVDECPIYLYRNESGTGPSAARNKGIEIMSKSVQIYGMLDADDIYLPGKISKSVVKILESPAVVGIVYTDAIIRHENIGLDIHEMRQPYDRVVLERECIISNTPFITKLAMDTIGNYDEEMRTCEDWDLYMRITERFVAIHIPEPLHIYSVTGSNTTQTIDKELWGRNWRRVQEKRLGRRK